MPSSSRCWAGTGSGLTLAVYEPSLPHALLWWCSLIQWVGGVGVIALTVSILSRPGSGSYTLYRSEARDHNLSIAPIRGIGLSSITAFPATAKQ